MEGLLKQILCFSIFHLSIEISFDQGGIVATPRSSGVAIGGVKVGQIAPLTTTKCPKNGRKSGEKGEIGKKRGKKRKNREEKAKIGKGLTLPLLTDRAGYATASFQSTLFSRN